MSHWSNGNDPMRTLRHGSGVDRSPWLIPPLVGEAWNTLIPRLIPLVIQNVYIAPLGSNGEDLVRKAKAGDPIALGSDGVDIATQALVFQMRFPLCIRHRRLISSAFRSWVWILSVQCST